MLRTLSLLAVMLVASTALAQFDLDPPKKPKLFSDVGSVSAEIIPAKARRGEVVTYKVTVTPKTGAHTYPTLPSNPNQAERNSFALGSAGDLIFVGSITDPPGIKVTQDGKDEYTSKVTWNLTAVVSPNATPGKKQIPFPNSHIQVCSDQGLCFDAGERNLPKVELDISADPAETIPEKYAAEVKAALNPKPAPAAAPRETPQGPVKHLQKRTPVPVEKYAEDLDSVRLSIKPVAPPDRTGLGAFLATAALWGLISLVTPCVFPMIPITISIFLKQSHHSTAQTLKLASVYCLTIIVVLGVSAFALLSIFVNLSVNPFMNVFMGALFIVFALSLFGMYDLTLPQGMLRFTQSKQGSGGVVGTMFGAIAFTIIGFTCVAPFLGGFAGMAASNKYSKFELVLGGLAFATAFASPFFVLALFPRLLKALPRSGGWLDSVKAVMGFLELAAALKFFRTAEIGWISQPEYFTYDLVMAGFVIIIGACGLYLLNLFRLPHDEEKPNIGVTRLLFALSFLTLSLYLLPAMFKIADGKQQRPSGVVFAWVDAFLLPDSSHANGTDDLPFGTDLKAALDDARNEMARTGKKSLVFVDFTGMLCQNCKYNENHIFPLPVVKDLLKNFQLVKLYTDWVPPEAYSNPPSLEEREKEAKRVNRKFQFDVFGTEQLPLYVILDPLVTSGVKVVGVYDEGKINDPARFAAFLREALEKAKP